MDCRFGAPWGPSIPVLLGTERSWSFENWGVFNVFFDKRRYTMIINDDFLSGKWKGFDIQWRTCVNYLRDGHMKRWLRVQRTGIVRVTAVQNPGPCLNKFPLSCGSLFFFVSWCSMNISTLCSNLENFPCNNPLLFDSRVVSCSFHVIYVISTFRISSVEALLCRFQTSTRRRRRWRGPWKGKNGPSQV